MLAPAVQHSPRRLDLARVLLVHDELAPRLALQTLLQAGGYSVDVAASAAEAYAKLDDHQYELVVSTPAMESPEAGVSLLAYARVKEYQPATALVTAYGHQRSLFCGKLSQQVSINTEDVTLLLAKVAELIGHRVRRRSGRSRRRPVSKA